MNNWDLNHSENYLFLGEGNFSFSSSVAQHLHDATHLYCTSLDSEEILSLKYPNDAINHIQLLKDYEANVLFSIDCKHLYSHFKSTTFKKIIFNFPHVGMGIKDQDRNILLHQQFLIEFFLSAAKVITEDGLIYVTLKMGLPYDEWKVKKQAALADLVLLKSFKFIPSHYIDYEHRRTIGFDEKKSTTESKDLQKNECRTYVFCTGKFKNDLTDAQKKTKNEKNSDDEDGVKRRSQQKISKKSSHKKRKML